MLKVTAAIIIQKQKVLIAQRSATDHLPNQWEFPGGKLEIGEGPEEGLKREIWEEFGIEIKVGDCLGKHIHHYNHESIELAAYRAYWLRGELKSTSHADYRWVSFYELPWFKFCAADVPFIKIIANKYLN